MQTRTISIVAPSLKVTTFDLADIDVDIYVRHVKAMRTPACVFVDNEVAYPGLFDSDRIAQAKKKLKIQSKKDSK